MKNTLLVLLGITTIALAAACIVQWQKLSGQKTEIASLHIEMEQQTREIADLQASQNLIGKQSSEFLGQAAVLAEKLQARKQADANVAKQSSADAASASDSQKPDKGGFGDLLAKMMDDPDTRKMIRVQQRMVLNQLYDPLTKKLGLTPAEAGQFKDLLADNMMKSTEKATSLFGGDSTTNRTEMLTTLAAEQKSFDEEIKGFLGETRYAQYKDYQQTVGERTQLNQFRMQTGGGENALTDQQTEQLLGFMREEKQAVAATTGLPLPGETQDAANLQAMFSGGGAEKILQAQETINQRVYERAKEALSENQLSAFAQFQTNQLQMMRMGMSMAQKFMSPEKTEGATTPANQ